MSVKTIHGIMIIQDENNINESCKNKRKKKDKKSDKTIMEEVLEEYKKSLLLEEDDNKKEPEDEEKNENEKEEDNDSDNMKEELADLKNNPDAKKFIEFSLKYDSNLSNALLKMFSEYISGLVRKELSKSEESTSESVFFNVNKIKDLITEDDNEENENKEEQTDQETAKIQTVPDNVIVEKLKSTIEKTDVKEFINNYEELIKKEIINSIKRNKAFLTLDENEKSKIINSINKLKLEKEDNIIKYFENAKNTLLEILEDPNSNEARKIIEAVKIDMSDALRKFRDDLEKFIMANSSVIKMFYNVAQKANRKVGNADESFISKLYKKVENLFDIVKTLLSDSPDDKIAKVITAAFSPSTLKTIVKDSGARAALTTFLLGLSMVFLLVGMLGLVFFVKIKNDKQGPISIAGEAETFRNEVIKDMNNPNSPIRKGVLSKLGYVLGWTLYKIPTISAVGYLALFVSSVGLYKLARVIEPPMYVFNQGGNIKVFSSKEDAEKFSKEKANGARYEIVKPVCDTIFSSKKNLKEAVAETELNFKKVNNIIIKMAKIIPTSLTALVRKLLNIHKRADLKMAIVQGIVKGIKEKVQSESAVEFEVVKYGILKEYRNRDVKIIVKDDAVINETMKIMYGILLEFSLTGFVGSLFKKLLNVTGIGAALQMAVQFIRDSVGNISIISNLIKK